MYGFNCINTRLGLVPSQFVKEVQFDNHSYFVMAIFTETMSDSTMELIAEAASNSLFIFCFCNLIIGMIFIAYKPSSSFEQESEDGTPAVISNTYAYTEQETNSAQSCQSSITVKELSSPQQEQEAPTEDREDDRNDNNDWEEDDELRRRVEECIEKANRGWRKKG